MCALAGGNRIIAPSVGPRLSVVVPTLNEARSVAALLADLRSLRLVHEVVVVDGGSSDATCAVAREGGARVITAARGRGTQLRAGAAGSLAPLLCFLHADVRLDPAALRQIERIAELGPGSAYAFRLAIDRPGPVYRFIEWGANIRSRWARLPYGDQGLVVWREDYDRAGGYLAIAVMEDVALVRALGRLTGVRLLPARIRVSPRRWEREGPVRRTVANWRLLLAYLAGVPADRLARRYRPSGDQPPEDA